MMAGYQGSVRFRCAVPCECLPHKLLEMPSLYFIKFICTFIPSIKFDLTILSAQRSGRGQESLEVPNKILAVIILALITKCN
jgi:hypothetical protein